MNSNSLNKIENGQPPFCVTMPHMGSFTKVFGKYIFEQLGLKVLTTPMLNHKTIKNGIGLSGEQFCMPLKITIGDIKLGIEMGAEAVIYTANCGPCRYGRYWDVIKNILDAYFKRDISFYLIEHGNEIMSIYNIVGSLGISLNEKSFIDIIKKSACKLDQLIQIEQRAIKLSAAAQNKYQVKAVLDKNLTILSQASTYQEMKKAKKLIFREFKKVKTKSKKRLKILVIGEIYELVEPMANLNILEKLSFLDVEADTSLSYNELANFRIMYDMVSKLKIIKLKKLVVQLNKGIKDFFGRDIAGFGGYGRTSIAFASIAKKKGYDGIIHLYPFTCMPEIIAKPFIEKICKDQKIPVLFLSLDEHFSEEGFNTRIEAFVDMLNIRLNKTL